MRKKYYKILIKKNGIFKEVESVFYVSIRVIKCGFFLAYKQILARSRSPPSINLNFKKLIGGKKDVK